jgi:hypothetical protein
MTRWLFLAVVVLALAVNFPVLAQEDAHIGTWKMNFEKSKVSPAPSGPRPQSVTRTYEKSGNGLKATLSSVSADGKGTTATWTSTTMDGRDYPYKGAVNADTIAVKKIDAYAFESVVKMGTKVVNTGVNAVSKDGKTMTWTFKGTNPQGQPTSGVQVFDKQ